MFFYSILFNVLSLGNGIIAVDTKLGGGLSSLPSIAVQKLAITRLHSNDSDLIHNEISSLPSLNQQIQHSQQSTTANLNSTTKSTLKHQKSQNGNSIINGSNQLLNQCEKNNSDNKNTNQIHNSHSTEVISTSEHINIKDIKQQQERDQFYSTSKPRLDPSGMKLPLTPNGKLIMI